MSAVDRRLFSHVNWWLVICMCTLFLVGVGNLYSASGVRIEDGLEISTYYQRQMVWGGVGLVCMLLVMSVDYRKLRTLAWPLFMSFVPILCVSYLAMSLAISSATLPSSIARATAFSFCSLVYVFGISKISFTL